MDEAKRVENLWRERALGLSQCDGTAMLCDEGYCVTTLCEEWPVPRRIRAVLLRKMADGLDQPTVGIGDV